jgi:hypothetical protein
MNKVNRIILCIIDDIRSDQFFHLLKNDLLPNCKKLVQNCIYSKNCVTDFPSVTYPTQVSTITGTYTGDYRNELCHGIPAFHWMDKQFSPPLVRNYGSNNLQIYKLNSDLGRNCQTICEMIPEGNKTSITQFINRGVDYFFPENKLKLIFYYLIINYYKKIKTVIKYANNIVVQKLLDNFKNPSKYFDVNEPPICSLIWFMSSDILLHKYGSESKVYKLNLLHIDKLIGKLFEGLRELGYLEDTAIAILSDHGNYKAEKVGTLNNIIKSLGLKNYHPHKNSRGNVNISEFDGIGFFNFKQLNNFTSKDTWNPPNKKDLENYGPKKINLFEKLFKIEGTSLMYYAEAENNYQKGKILLKRKKNNQEFIHGILEYEGTGKHMKTRYINLNEDEGDIFGYYKDVRAHKCLDGKFHTIDEWLETTHHVDFPLYPDLLCRHYKNPRSADIILSTEGRITYNIEHGIKQNEQIYKHDIGAQSSSIVPLIITGSNEIPKKKIEFCKITDVVPTLMTLLGKKVPKSVIGNSLI